MPQLMVAVTLAVVLTYVASVLLNVSRFELPGKFGPAIEAASPMAARAIASVVPAMIVWATFAHLPMTGTGLSEYSLTRDFVETNLPYFANLFDLRYLAAGLSLVIGIARTLPQAMGIPFLRY